MSASNQTTNDPEFGLPVGAILPYCSTVAIPNTFLLCDGASVLITDYPYLFDSIGIIYGQVDAQHFNVPDLTNNYILGSAVNAGTINPSDITGTLQFGALTTANLPATAIPLTGGAYTFSGAMSSTVYESNPSGTSISNTLGATAFVNENPSSTFSGGVVTLNSYSVSSVNANAPLNVPITVNNFSLKGYTMPYIIKASPAFTVVV
jgi:microcystin-dependent protein